MVNNRIIPGDLAGGFVPLSGTPGDTITGRLENDPEMRAGADSEPVVNFSAVAINSEEKCRFNVAARNELAVSCDVWLRKGDIVVVEGRPSIIGPPPVFSIEANNIALLSKKI